MRKKFLFLILVSVLILLLKQILIPKEKTCVWSIRVDDMGADGRYYLDKVGKQNNLMATNPLDNNFEPVKFDFNIKTNENTWLLGHDRISGEVLINSDYFSDIMKVDATQLKNPFTIGKLKKTDMSNQSFREIIELLLKSHIISSYWHLYSDICLISETSSEAKYIAKFNVTHEFCTNKCLTGKYPFSIEINKQNGDVTILPK
jgi:hypothetical protein